MRGRKPFNPAAIAEPLWTTVAAKGCNPVVVASPNAAKLGRTAKLIFCLITAWVWRAIAIASKKLLRLSSMRTTSAVSLATSEPQPKEIATSA